MAEVCANYFTITLCKTGGEQNCHILQFTELSHTAVYRTVAFCRLQNCHIQQST